MLYLFKMSYAHEKATSKSRLEDDLLMSITPAQYSSKDALSIRYDYNVLLRENGIMCFDTVREGAIILKQMHSYGQFLLKHKI